MVLKLSSSLLSSCLAEVINKELMNCSRSENAKKVVGRPVYRKKVEMVNK